MNALHEAVARAIAEAMYATDAEEQAEVREAAAAAIGVCLAEAQRSIEALQARARPQAHGGGPYSYSGALADALAALAALAEEQA